MGRGGWEEEVGRRRSGGGVDEEVRKRRGRGGGEEEVGKRKCRQRASSLYVRTVEQN